MFWSWDFTSVPGWMWCNPQCIGGQAADSCFVLLPNRHCPTVRVSLSMRTPVYFQLEQLNWVFPLTVHNSKRITELTVSMETEAAVSLGKIPGLHMVRNEGCTAIRGSGSWPSSALMWSPYPLYVCRELYLLKRFGSVCKCSQRALSKQETFMNVLCLWIWMHKCWCLITNQGFSKANAAKGSLPAKNWPGLYDITSTFLCTKLHEIMPYYTIFNLWKLAQKWMDCGIWMSFFSEVLVGNVNSQLTSC